MKRIIISAFVLLLSQGLLLAGNLKGRVTCQGRPVEGVTVSDGQYFAVTDKDGRYDFYSHKVQGLVFITTPSGYIARGNDPLRPGFWQYYHLAKDKDEIHDFELVPQDQSRYSFIFLPDMHFVNDPEREDLRRFRQMCYPRIKKAIDEASAHGPVYSAHLGDFTHDLYWYEFGFNESDGFRMLQDLGYPTPIYAVMGNHDHDAAITGINVDFLAGWRYRDVWGPECYSVNIGRDHWIFVDNIIYKNIEGKGKKNVGVKGDRSYDTAMTPEQMAWIEKDLEMVGSSSRVFLCCHCPVFCTTRQNHDLPQEQVETLNRWAGRFNGGITVYSGHIHMWNICEKEQYPNLHQFSFPAGSGIMWETIKDYPLYSSDGSDAGVMMATFSNDKDVSYEFLTYSGGEKILRVYDMNEVGKVYKADKYCAMQHEKYPKTRQWYADRKYRNYVYVNFWGSRPGDKLEVFEKGRALSNECRNDEDPTKNFVYELKYFANGGKTHKKDPCASMHQYKTSSAKTPVTVRVTDRNGVVKFEQTYQRPLPFVISGTGISGTE